QSPCRQHNGEQTTSGLGPKVWDHDWPLERALYGREQAVVILGVSSVLPLLPTATSVNCRARFKSAMSEVVVRRWLSTEAPSRIKDRLRFSLYHCQSAEPRLGRAKPVLISWDHLVALADGADAQAHHLCAIADGA